MPIHDWTRVSAGTLHSFHLTWISEILLALNDGIMPERYYAQAEQITGPYETDVFTLQSASAVTKANDRISGGLAVAIAPPRPKLVAEDEMDRYVLKRR